MFAASGLLRSSLLRGTFALRSMASQTNGGPVEESIRTKLTELLAPSSLEISNDSWKHRHHAPMRAVGGGDGETHFSVQVVSQAFTGMNTMKRHRMIYSALSDELKAGLHALSLQTRTPAEVEKLGKAPS